MSADKSVSLDGVSTLEVGLFTEIENELGIAREKVVTLKNLWLGQVNGSTEEVALSGALVVLSYAAMEGAVVRILRRYVGFLNALELDASNARGVLVAASHQSVFECLVSPNSNLPGFTQDPIDKKLVLYSRHGEFVERSSLFISGRLLLPEERFHASGNLTPDTLKRLLFKLAIPHEWVDTVQHGRRKAASGDLQFILEHRNRIAHGEANLELSKETVNGVLDAVNHLLGVFGDEVRNAASNELYLRAGHH